MALPLIVFISLQRYFVRGIYRGSRQGLAGLPPA
jgi:ABC-type glycerol-3-phosphate transport system permease component